MRAALTARGRRSSSAATRRRARTDTSGTRDRSSAGRRSDAPTRARRSCTWRFARARDPTPVAPDTDPGSVRSSSRRRTSRPTRSTRAATGPRRRRPRRGRRAIDPNARWRSSASAARAGHARSPAVAGTPSRQSSTKGSASRRNMRSPPRCRPARRIGRYPVLSAASPCSTPGYGVGVSSRSGSAACATLRSAFDRART
jgi:hypothetical protein